MRIRLKASSCRRRGQLALAVLKSHRDAVLRERRISMAQQHRRLSQAHTFEERMEFVYASHPEVPAHWTDEKEALEGMASLPADSTYEVDLSVEEFAALERWRRMTFRPAPSNQEVLDYA